MGALNRVCQDYLGKYRTSTTAKKQKLHIEVTKFMGKNGAFAAGKSELYRTEVVGVNGKRENINNWQNEGYGTGSVYANRDAAKCAAMLGCPVVFVDKIAETK